MPEQDESMYVAGFPKRILVHSRHLELPPDLSWHEYAMAGRHLSTMESLAHDTLPWLLGDFVNFGKAQYGEKYAQALDLTDYTKGTITQMAYVARHVKPEDRILPLSFMCCVASKNETERRKLSERAVDEGLLQSEFRRLVRGDKEYRKPIRKNIGISAKHERLLDEWEMCWAEHEREWSSGTAKENATRIWEYALKRALGRHGQNE